MRKELLTDRDDFFLLHDYLTPDECRHYVTVSEAAGYGDAPINGPGGAVVRKDVRNNDRVMIDDPALAADLWDKAAPHVPTHYGRYRAVGLNERLRFYRYTPGQRFYWHLDGHFARGPGERSHLTFMVYLSDECEGGETEFIFADGGISPDRQPDLRVTPRAGAALVFPHPVLHQGAAVTRGVKYVLRTDVMYRYSGGG